MNFDNTQILAQLETILSDKTFSRSKTNCRLLTFLVKLTLENEDVKETTIGEEFFGVNYDPVKSDNNVRVYIYHLRKKLNEYYSSRANPNEIVFSIAKGQYNVQFEEYKKPSEPKNTISHHWIIYGTIFNLSLLGLFLFLYFPNKTINNFWKTMMKNDFPTTVIFGDYFTIETQIKTGRKGIIRDYSINSEQELQAHLEEYPNQGKMKASNHRYFNWMAPHCSKSITEFWLEHNYSFEIVQVSEWSISQLENDNLVYFGQSKSMGTLKNFLVEKFPNYSYYSQLIVRIDPNTNVKTKYWDVLSHEGKNIDYTIVAKVAMPTGNEMRFFLSDQDCGAISALQYFTNNDSVAAFYNRHELKQEDDFIALFKVTGWERKTYDMEFVSLDK